MITFTVHERDSDEQDIAARAEAAVFVKEGFAWVALFFPILWQLYHAMWIVLVGFIVIVGAVQAGVIALGLDDGVAVMTTFVLSGVFALLANDLRRWSLARRGYRLVELVSGRDRAECENKFFTHWLAAQGPQADAPPKAVKRTKPAPAAPGKSSSGGEDVIGLFPEPGK